MNEGTAEEQYWVLYSYDWGYADNVPNEDEGSTFDIDWAVDKKGNICQVSTLLRCIQE